MASKATDAEGKLQKPYCDGERKMWDWDKYVLSTKDSMPSWRALQTMATVEWIIALRPTTTLEKGIKCSKLVAAVNVVCT